MDVMSVDVENWWDSNLLPSGMRGDAGDVCRETEAVLDLLAEHGARATFFVLGAIASAHPELVRRMAREGHEVACHGWEHTLVRDLSPARFADSVGRARALLEDLSGTPVTSHRAPSWSIGTDTPWAPDALLTAGFTDDSSIFPLRSPLYGVAGAPIHPYRLVGERGELREWPPAARDIARLRIPAGGGIYWGLLPYAVVRWGVSARDVLHVVYIHPWSAVAGIQAGVERVPARLRWAITAGRAQNIATFRRLLRSRTFTTLSEATRSCTPVARYRLLAQGLAEVKEEEA